MATEKNIAIFMLKAARALFLYPFVVIAGLIVFAFFYLLFLPLVSVFQLVRFAVDRKFREALARRGEPAMGSLSEEKAYFHPGHTWAKVEGEKIAVGPDDFTSALVGTGVSEIEHAEVGMELKSGEPVWRLLLGDRSLEQVMPISGTVIEVNGKILRDPSLMGRLPVKDLWVVKILPSVGMEEIKNLLTWASFKKWNEKVKDRILAGFHREAGLVHADGGAWTTNLAAKLTDKQWEELVAQEYK